MLGEIVADRYLVRAVLGEGGMGRVYRAVQLDLERPVAIKLLNESLAPDPRQVSRFHREAMSASRLDHPGVAVVHDHGEWEGRLYLVMEFLRGATLRQLLSREGPLEPMRAAGILAQVADVLTAAHDAGMVHRDLKPENIMICPGRAGTERVKVVDFGLAALLGQDDWEHGPRGRMLSGTPWYMSPEQCRGDRVGAASDLYSLGVVLFEMLCGRPPFASDNAAEVVLCHLYSEPLAPARADGLPVHPRLGALAMEALAKEPDRRPASAERFRDLVLEAAGNQSDGAPAGGPSADGADGPAAMGHLPTLADIPWPTRVAVRAASEPLARALAAVLAQAGVEVVVELTPAQPELPRDRLQAVVEVVGADEPG